MTTRIIIAAFMLGTTLPAAPALASGDEHGVVVNPDAFTETARTLRKKGVTVSHAQLAPLGVGIDKDSLYTLIGPPHFGEGITRRWNYVIFITRPAEPLLRCRLQIDFGDGRDGYNVAAERLTWSSEECLRAASA